MVDINIYEIILQIINFLIVLFILNKYLYGPIMTFMTNRQQTIEADLHNSKKDRSEAQELLDQQKKEIQSARKEAQQIRERAEHIATDEQKVILEQAHRQAKEIVENTKLEINKEVDLARESLVKEIGQLTVKMTSQVLQKEVNPNLVDTTIAELGIS